MALFKKKAGGTKVGNLVRKVTQSNLGKAAIGAVSPVAGLAVRPIQKPKPMVFPVGAGLTGQQQVSAYKAVAPKSPMAKGIQSVKPTNLGPQYTPIPGGSLAYTPIPGGKLDFTNRKSKAVNTTQNNGGFMGGNGGYSSGGSKSTSTIGSYDTPSARIAGAGLNGTNYSGITTGDKTQATAGDLVAGNTEYDYNLTPEQRAYEESLREQAAYNEKQARQTVDPESIYQDTLRQFQGEIDATNEIYAQKLAEAKRQGQSRLGTTRAENFNAGAVNSSFGNAAQERTQKFNMGIEGGIQNEKIQMLSQIENNARELGNKYYEAKKTAKEAGLEAYVTNLKGVKDAKEAITTEIANNMFMSDVTPDELTPKKLEQIAKSAGVTVQSIKSTFKALQIAQAEAEAEAALKGQFNLSEGQARYDARGNLIASRAKTYKGGGGSGSGFGGSSVSEAALNFAKQIQSGAATLAQVPAAMRAEVATAMMQLPSQKVQELDQVINLIDELSSNPKLDNITGPTDQFIGGVFGKAAVAKNIYNQLQGVLALEGRSKLKGSGAISDFEFRVLKDAQSALGRNIPASAMRAELEKVKGILNKRRQTLISQGFIGDTSSDNSEEEDYVITGQEEQVTLPDGTVLTLQADGTYE